MHAAQPNSIEYFARVCPTTKVMVTQDVTQVINMFYDKHISYTLNTKFLVPQTIHFLYLYYIITVQCHSNNDCPDDESCESGSCIKVCSRTRCGIEAHCVARGHTASCECDVGAHGNAFIGCRRAECVVDEDCVSWLACSRETCKDPCLGACAQGAICTVERHVPTCECPRGTQGNPKIDCQPGL